MRSRPDAATVCGVRPVRRGGLGGGFVLELGEDVVQGAVQVGEVLKVLVCDPDRPFGGADGGGEGGSACAAGEELGLAGGVGVDDSEDEVSGAEVHDASLWGAADVWCVG